MNKIVELFGHATRQQRRDWSRIVRGQQCPFLQQKCYKVRKSDPGVSIGSCTVLHGMAHQPIIVCPSRFLERQQIFTDCLHLLTTHEPGNELHLLPEVSIPGGKVDYFLVSARKGKVKDFVGIEMQALDTSGTTWPERQRLLKQLGVHRSGRTESSLKTYGMNWKMTAKTILIQMHHKVKTFEHVGRRLVLVLQNRLFSYMAREFDFEHLRQPAALGDSMHLHVYHLEEQTDHSMMMAMESHLSTDAQGIAKCLGLQAEDRLELEQIVAALEAKLSSSTVFKAV